MTVTAAEISQLKKKALRALAEAASAAQLENWRIVYIGRKGSVPKLLREVKDLSVEDRKKIGKEANDLRQELEELYEQKQTFPKPPISPLSRGEKNSSLEKGRLGGVSAGHMHPITMTIRRIQDILASLEFFIVEGPEVEEARFNFDQLNIPLEHPARAESDTFYLKNQADLILRTQTSPVQLRAVLENNLIPPFKIASPGRVFRNEKPDATHESTFHQIEALVVGDDIAVADYRGTTETLFSTFFGRPVKIRLRPGYFPFVEPGFEVDMTCPFCNDGCRVCKFTQWIEMGGAGMVHPNVLKNMNIDSKKFQGFAFGYGIDRLAMLWHSIDDIRLFWSGDIRFLKQFS